MSTYKPTFEKFDASGYRIGIVVSKFNVAITDQLLSRALKAAKEFNIAQADLSVHKVAGSVEIPVVLSALAKTGKYDALVALGAIIRGETDHYDYVAKIVTEGVLRVMLDSGVPVGFGILTCANEAQASARVSSGEAAIVAAIENARILRTI